MTQEKAPSQREPAAPRPQALRGIGVFVELERRVRRAVDLDELAFIMVNETCSLARYRQALLWLRDGPGRGSVRAVSGLAVPDREAPFLRWIEQALSALDAGDEARPVVAADVPAPLAAGWAEWLPAYGLWLPLVDRTGRRAALLLARDTPWTDQERHLLDRLAEAYGHAWGALAGTGRPLGGQVARALGRRRVALAAVMAMVAASLVPVHHSALAPAEIVARDPAVVRAPIDGVVDHFVVRPNDAVSEGGELLRLDATRLGNRLDVARKAFEVAEAEYRQAAQQAVSDPRMKASLAILKGRMEQESAEVSYVEGLFDRIVVRAPRSGLAIFDDPSEWLGRPVVIGERILLLADPDAVEVEIHLAVGDAIRLEEGARVRLFLNVDPHRPLDAVVRYIGYQSELTPSGILAYRLVATLDDQKTVPRIGLKGTAKLYGGRTILILYLLRRPLATLRQWAGL